MGNVQVQAGGRISLSAKLTYCSTSAASRFVFPRSCSLATTKEQLVKREHCVVYSSRSRAYRSTQLRYSPQSGYHPQFQMLEPGTFEISSLSMSRCYPHARPTFPRGNFFRNSSVLLVLPSSNSGGSDTTLTLAPLY